MAHGALPAASARNDPVAVRIQRALRAVCPSAQDLATATARRADGNFPAVRATRLPVYPGVPACRARFFPSIHRCKRACAFRNCRPGRTRNGDGRNRKLFTAQRLAAPRHSVARRPEERDRQCSHIARRPADPAEPTPVRLARSGNRVACRPAFSAHPWKMLSAVRAASTPRSDDRRIRNEGSARAHAGIRT